MLTHNILIPFLLTLFAGLATGIGSAIAFMAKTTNKRFLAGSLGFSAGVMVYVSFVELFSEAQHSLSGIHGDHWGTIITVICFFGGMLLIGVIDRFVPSFENPHEIRSVEDMQDPKKAVEFSVHNKMMRVGLMSALAIGIHNFPEGMATFISAIQDPTLGIAIAVAVAIHNIPEGIAVAVPIYFATRNKKKAFYLSLCSGLAEPIGALVAYLILMPFLSDTLLGCVFAAVAGIMVFISFDELLPAAQEYGEHHASIWGMVLGMIVMAASLIMLA